MFDDALRPGESDESGVNRLANELGGRAFFGAVAMGLEPLVLALPTHQRKVLLAQFRAVLSANREALSKLPLDPAAPAKSTIVLGAVEDRYVELQTELDRVLARLEQLE